MTTPKLIENTLVPELAKSEHKEKDLPKRELASGRRADETWIPGQGTPVLITTKYYIS